MSLCGFVDQENKLCGSASTGHILFNGEGWNFDRNYCEDHKVDLYKELEAAIQFHTPIQEPETVVAIGGSEATANPSLSEAVRVMPEPEIVRHRASDVIDSLPTILDRILIDPQERQKLIDLIDSRIMETIYDSARKIKNGKTTS